MSSSRNNRSSEWKHAAVRISQEENKNNDQDLGSPTEIKPRSSININTMQPQELKNIDVCLLYEKYLQGLEVEDRETSIEKLKREMITGTTLVKASENCKVMKELITTLSFPLDLKLRFDDMMKEVKKRLKELKLENNEGNENEQACQLSPTDVTNTPKEYAQVITNAGFVFGPTYNSGQTQNLYTACNYYGKDKKQQSA